MYDLSGCDRDRFTHPERARRAVRFAPHGPTQIFREIEIAAHKVHSARRARARESGRIRRQKVRRRRHVEDLSSGEGHGVLVLLGDAANSGGGSLPPAFDREESVGIDVEWKGSPFLGAEAIVMRQGAAARIGGSMRATNGKLPVLHGGEHRPCSELEALAG